jgi:hypothetical protein
MVPKARYSTSHQITKAADVDATEIATEVPISFAHSQYDTRTFPVGAIAALHLSRRYMTSL